MPDLFETNISNSLVSTKIASDLSGYNPDYLARVCREGKIKGAQIGRSWLIDKNSLEQFVALQQERKRELALQTAKVREQEYKIANAVVPVTDHIQKASNVAAEKARSVISPIQRTQFALPIGPTRVHRPLVAAAVALVFTVGTAYASTAPEVQNILAQLPQNVQHVADLVTRPRAIDDSFRITETTSTHKTIAADLNVPSAKNISRNFAYVTGAKSNTYAQTFAAASITASTNDSQSSFASAFSSDNNARVAQSRINAIGDAVMHPSEVASAFVNGYVHTGATIFAAAQSIGDAYLATVRGTADTSLAVASVARDIVADAPENTDGLLALYEQGVYGWVDSSHDIAQATAGTMYDTGSVVGELATNLPNAVVQTRGALADMWVDRSLAIANSAADAQTDVGTKALAVADSVGSRYLGAVDTSGSTLAGAYEALPSAPRISVPSAVSLPNLPDVHTPSQQVAETAQNAAQAIASGVPENVSFSTISDLTQDAMLGMAGKIMAWAESNTGNVASTNEGSNTSVATNLTASVISFAPISWQRTIEHLLVGAGELAQALIHAGVRAIADTFSLPGAFAPELAVVPFGPTQSMSLPHPTNIGGVAINTSATTTSGTVIKGPTTYIQNIINNFSKDAFGASFNDAVLAIVGPYVRSSIDSAISSVRGGGGGGDVTSSNAHLTNVTISGGTATLSSADIGSLVAGSTTTGSLTTTGTTTLATTTVNGDLTVTGTISAGSLAVTSVTSDGPVIAPYFTATSTTGTSTFPNLAATNAVIDNATTTNFFTTNLSAVAANITNAVFGSFVSNLANITTATITNLTGTNSQFVNSTTTNATTTNFYATNGVIDNATTTNFFSLNGFIDTFFSTFANIATAVITNLTGTNSQFVNSTTTNSVATNATTTNLSATNADITNAILTNATSTNFAANNGVITNLTGTNATSTNSFATNANFDNATSTNFFSALGSFTNAIFGSFVATLANITTATITNLTGTNSQFVNSTTTNVTTTNLFAANATTTNFSTTNGAITNLTSTNAQLGNATTTNLAVTGLVGSDLIPAINNQYSVGSPGATWSNGYFDSIHVNNFFVASTSIDGTASNVFSINSDNASVDAEDSTLVFNRGTVSPNATLTWNSTLKRFDFSHPIQTPSLSTASFTLGSSTFTSLLGAGLADVGGALTVTVSSTSLALDSTYFKQGGNSFGSTATIGTRDNNPLNIITNNAVAGTFLASGFLGLGTTSPTERLSVAGNAVISGSLKAASLLTTGNANVGSLTIGSLSGFLKATAGAVSTALVDLSTDVTSTLPVGNGGTGIATPPSLGNLLVGNGSGGYSLTSTSTLGLGASYFQQNGNSFGATATLGTNDNNDLVFETNNVERLRVNTSGQLISNIASAANTPAFTWASDLTTGIFHPAINQIGFSTGGIQRIVVDGNGNLGVGSSSPNARLTVKGAGTTTGINFQTTNSSDVPLITVLDSGNVGIGTTTPAALLSVGGITTTPAGGILLGDIQIYRSNPSNIAFGPSSIAVTANNFTATTNFAAGSIGSYFGSGSAAAGAPAVTINTNTATRDNLVIHQAASQTANTLRIEDSSANILSTLTPVGASNSRQQFFLYNTLETTPTNYERLAIYPDSTNNVFRIDAQIGGTGVRRNLILQGAGGNVGIGTTSPFAKLTVVGDLSITGGGIYDNNSTRGTLGQILQTTGTGIQWVSTTSLGFASSSSVGSANQVAYYNSGGVLGGTSGFTFDGTNLSVGGTITAGSQFIGIGGTGAANTPAYTFSGDLTTGIFHPASNNVAISTGGIERLRVDGNGNVGIGTTTPSNKLEVNGNTYLGGTVTAAGVFTGTSAVLSSSISLGGGGFTINGANAISYTAGATSQTVISIAPGSLTSGIAESLTTASNAFTGTLLNVGYTGTGSGKPVVISSSNASASGNVLTVTNAGTGNLATFSGTGNVGIGTTTPFAKLTVVGDLSITGGGIYDNNSTRGTLGQILQTTGTGIQWVSTTSLGFASSTSVGAANQVAYYNSGGTLGGTAGFTFDGTNLSVGGSITATGQHIGIGGTGAANTPAFTFSGDLTTGIFHPANNNIGFSTGGIERLRVDGSGNVGIGTSTPQTALDIAGTFGTYGAVTIGAPSQAGSIGFRTGATVASVNGIVGFNGATAATDFKVSNSATNGLLSLTTTNNSASGGIRFTTANVERGRFDFLGNLGIGTTTPSAKLDLYGTTTSADLFAISSSSNTRLLTVTSAGNLGLGTSSPFAKLTVVGDLSITGGGIYDNNATRGTTGQVLQTTGTGIQWVSTTTLGFASGTSLGSANQVAYYNSGGTLGGTSGFTFDGTNLSVGGTITATGQHIGIGGTGAANTPAFTFSGDLTTGIFHPASNQIGFSTGGIQRAVIDGNGFVGIGTTTPGGTLSIGYSTNSAPAFIVGSTTATAAFLVGGNGQVVVNSGDQTLNITSNAKLVVNGTAFASSFNLSNGGSVSWNNTTTRIAGNAGSNLIQFFTNNIEAARFSGASFGVGTTTPAGQLAASSTGTTPTLYVQQNSTGAAGVFLGGNVGIGTSSPFAKLSVVGDLSLSGGIYDNNTTRGTLGQILQTTGTGIQWVSTTSLGFASSTSVGAANQVAYYNSGGVLGGTSGFTFDGTNLSVGGTITAGSQFIGIGGTGAANTPAYTFSGDLTTGIFHPASNQIGFSTGGIQRAVIDGSGNLGVGSSSPNARLTVKGAGTTTGINFQTTNSNDLPIITSLDSGFVGIGTAAPTSALTLNATSSVTGLTLYNTADQTTNYERVRQYWSSNVYIINAEFGGTGTARAIQLTTSGKSVTLNTGATATGLVNFSVGTASNGVMVGVNGALSASSGNQTMLALQQSIGQTSTAGYTGLVIQPTETTLGSGTKLLVQVGTSSAPNLFDITNTGNVGIGTSTPGQKLTVYGTGEAARFGDDTNTNTYIGFSGNPALSAPRSAFGFNANTGNAVVQGASTKGIEFNVNNNTFGSGQAAVITSAGNFGIGTTTPFAKLTVIGDLSLSAGIYDNSATRGTLGQILQTTGTGIQWVSTTSLGFASSTSVGAANQVAYYNSGGTLGGTSGFTFDGTNLSVGGTITATGQHVGIGGTGAANTPAYTFASDLTTGIYHPASNNIGFTTGGVQRAVIDGNGNLGVGSSTPNARLSVKAAGTTTGINFQTTDSNNSPLFTILDNGNTTIGTTSSATAARLTVGAGNGYGLRISYDVLTGQGTFPLSVVNSNGIQTFALGGNQTATEGVITLTAPAAQGGGSGINFNAGTGKTGNFSLDIAGNFVFRNTSGGGGTFFDYNTGGLIFRNSAFVTTFKSDGINTGIGRANTTLASTFSVYDGTATTGATQLLVQGGAVAGDATTNQLFRINQGGGTTGLFVVQGNGNVGIGTSSPLAKLDIYGTAGTADIFSISSSSNSRLLTVASSGNLGIGSTTPGANLSILNPFGSGNTNVFSIGSSTNAANTASANLFTVNSVGSTTIAGSVAIAGGLMNDNTGRVNLGVGISGVNKAKCGIFVTDNFAAGCANQNGAFVGSEILNDTNYNGYSAGVFQRGSNVNILNNAGSNSVVFVGQGNTTTNTTATIWAQTNTVNIINAATSYGYVAMNYLQGTGQLGSYVGFQSQGGYATAGPTVTNQYDFRADPFSTLVNGTTTNRYGLYLGFDNTSITNAYGVYQLSPTVKNYFAGNVGFGTTSPTARVTIAGGVGSTTDLFVIASSSNTQFLTVKSAGNVGIGTTTPGSKLTVAGDLQLTGRYIDSLESSGTAGQVLLATATGTMWGNTAGTGTVTSVNASGGTTGLSFSGGPITSAGTLTLAGTLGIANGGTGTTTGGTTNGVEYFNGTNLTNGPNLTFTGSALALTGTQTITSALATALTVGANGATNPAFTVDASGVSSATGITIKSNAAASGADLLVTSSGTNENLKISAKGSGSITIGSSSTGNVAISRAATFASGVTITGAASVTTTFTAPTLLGGSGTGSTLTIKSTSGAGTTDALIFATGSSVERGRFTSAGLFGLGTSTPFGQLQVAGTSTAANFTSQLVLTDNAAGADLKHWSFTSAGGNLAIGPVTDALATSTVVTITTPGKVGIGTTTPGAQLTTTGTVQFANYGSAGATVTTDNDGNLSVSSDERLKNINGTFTRGLADIEKLSPILYHWNAVSGLEQKGQYAGFSAQNVQSTIPEAVATDSRGYLTLADRPIIAASVNAIKELAGQTGVLATTTSNLAGRLASVEAATTAQTAAYQSAQLPHAFTATEVTAQSLTIAQGVSAGTLTTHSVNADGTVSAARYVVPATAEAFSMGSTTITAALPQEALTDDGVNVDVYKLASYAVASAQALASRTDLLATRIDAIDSRVSALETAAQSTATSSMSQDAQGVLGLAAASVQHILESFGIFIRDGIAQFTTLVTHQLVFSSDTNGTSSAASVTIPAGQTEFKVVNSLIIPTSKVFVTFTSSVNGSWYLSKKEAGSFTVTLASAQTTDTTFDYFLVQTEGQIASVAGATPASPQPGSGTSGTDETGSSTAATPAPVSQDGGPIVTLNGEAAVQIPQGAAWTDPGATAKAADGTDLTSSIAVSGGVDTNTPGLYTVTYRATDAAGKYGEASRIVTVLGAPTSSPDTTPAPAASPAVTAAPTDSSDASSPAAVTPDPTPAS